MRLLVAVVAVLMTGCFGAGESEDAESMIGSPSIDWPRCEHPWPCGDGSEYTGGPTPPDGWPLREQEHVRAELGTGVTLDGAVWWPDIDGDVPIVLMATPYAGQCRYSSLVGNAGSASFNDYCEDPPQFSHLGDALYAWFGSYGFATALFNVRGTGLSGGCFDYYGETSQADMGALVEYLAQLPGSNGRVGMWGVSAMGTTPWMAAVEAPPSLKAIAPSGIISDLYLNRFTPQGAGTTEDTFAVMWSTQNSVVPAGGTLDNINLEEEQTFIETQTERGCQNALDNASTALRVKYTDDGAHDWWEERRLVKDFGNIEAAVFVQQGQWEGGHRYQEDAIWDHIKSPKRFLMGPWGHTFNLYQDELARYPYAAGSHDIYLEWFDFWLRGQGGPPRVGLVDSLDRDGRLDVLEAWPPEATMRALYLGSGGVTDAPSDVVSFRSAPDQGTNLCGVADEIVPALVLESEPLPEQVHIMGNPMALLDLTSDQPGGQVILDVYAIGPDDDCTGDFDVTDAFVSDGGANLRHHDGMGDGEPFPTGTAVDVRLDLMSVSKRLEAGDRLVVVLSGTGVRDYEDPQFAPMLTIGPDSHILLPLASGNLGVPPPDVAYPPRPRV